ncbi:MAG TPA: aminotransferase class I/II-fold pyridoxal phosphate-dependent enzyme [Gemmatimonadaceae bacterium]|jgi:histidinol-phosphate aminotransferase
MPVSRRSFVATLGAGATGLIGAPLLSWRGHEALLAQQQQPQLAAAEPHADRLLASMPGMVRLDSNENPNGPGQRALAAIAQHFGDANRYPVKQTDDLIAEIARVQGVKPENILLGCGSGELLRTAVQTFTSRDKALVAPDPTFESPGNFAKFLATPVRAPKVDSVLKLDLNTTADAAKGAGLVYYCNPNNPTSTVHGANDTKMFVDQVLRSSPDTTILIDEAYHEYVADPSYTTMIPLAVSNPRVIVTRTFSKVFGMAGLRAGYAIGTPETLKRMQPWMLGSNLNQLAIAAAMTTIGDKAHIAADVKQNAAARDFTRKFFEGQGYKIHSTDANFLMVDIHRDSKAFKMEVAKHKVAIGRQFPTLPTYTRISIGTMPEMKKAVVAFEKVLAAPAATSQQHH